MKTKKFSRKLMLNKKTIAHLNGSEMKNVPGGIPKPEPTVKDPECLSVTQNCGTCTCATCTCGSTPPGACCPTD